MEPTMEPEGLESLAWMLWSAEVTGEACAPPREVAESLSIGDAYAIQRLNVARRLGGEARPRLVGHKIGVTSEAVQRWLKVGEPDFGALLSTMEVLSGGETPMRGLLQPRVEGEIAFVLERDLPTEGVGVADVLRATAFVLPAIEIIDSRVRGWDITIVDTIADNASSARFVLGTQPVMLREIDPCLIGMALRKSGEVVSSGAGVASLGNPLRAVAWLANRLGALGERLEAGQVILSGALGPVCPVAAGDVVEVQLGARWRASARFVE